MTVLSQASLGELDPRVFVPGHAREQVSVGIGIIGPDAFHRAHKAMYVDSYLATGDQSGWFELDLERVGPVEVVPDPGPQAVHRPGHGIHERDAVADYRRMGGPSVPTHRTNDPTPGRTHGPEDQSHES